VWHANTAEITIPDYAAPGAVGCFRWGMDIVDAVNLVEPLKLREDSDHRLELELADGGSIRVDAFRMQRPGHSSQPEQ